MLLTGMICQPLWGGYADKMGDKLRLGRVLLLGTLLRCTALMAAFVTDAGTSNRLLLVMSMFVCAEGVMCGCLPVIDARVLSVLGDERRSLYGRQRLWGGIGWGLMAPIGGWMLGQYGLPVTLCGHVLGMCVGMVCVSQLPSGVGSMSSRGASESDKTVSLSEGISVVLSSPGVKSFLCVATGIVSVGCVLPVCFVAVMRIPHPMCVCMCMSQGWLLGVIESFLFLHLQSLGSSSTLMGLTLTFNCLAEAGSVVPQSPPLSSLPCRRQLFVPLCCVVSVPRCPCSSSRGI
jgi:hypothetical protein